MADSDPLLPKRFGDLVARLDSAMVVVTTVAHGERSGCLVGFHSQCSIHPPRYAVWISKANHTFGFIDRLTHVAVHVLDESNQALAELFGGETGDEVDKFAECSWTPGPFGVPLLDEAPTRLVGRRVSVDDAGGGDHVCLVVEPIGVDLGRDDATPVLHLSDEHDIEPGHPA